MEYIIKDFVTKFENIVPINLQEDWDNSGGQIIFSEEKIDSILLTLDITDESIQYAIENNIKLIFTHHPIFFSGIKNIYDNNYLGKNIISLIENKISVYSSHTSLDIVNGGVNDELSKILKLSNVKGLENTSDENFMGRIGENNNYSLGEIISIFSNNYSKYVRIYGKYPSKVETIALCGGAGASLINEAIDKKADLYITGDIKHHDAQYAYENNICVLDVGHFGSEVFILDKLKNLFENEFNLNVDLIDTNPFEINID